MTVWEEIKSKVEIDSVVGGYIDLKNKGGGNYSAKCPFHNEKTGSLIVSIDKQIWHCFGCGLGGDVFSFVQLIENTTLQESLVKLSKIANVNLENDNKPKKIIQRDEKGLSVEDKKYLMLSWVSEYYHQNLLNELKNPDGEISKYISKRGLDIETIKKFKLGLAPKQDTLEKLVKNDSEKIEILKSLSLIK